MKLFTPIINFDIDEKVNWVKISKFKIKKISSKDIADYFGAKIVRDNNFRPIEIISLKDPPTPQFIRYQSPSILNELQSMQLLGCKYAFVSSLKIDEHRKKVCDILDAFRLHKINGITCPVTFDTGIALHFIHPFESKMKECATFTKKEIKKVVSPLVRFCLESPFKSLPEVFSGNPPYEPGGTTSQAWSIAEVLRVLVEYKVVSL